jgi:hypothetical protein
MVPTSGNGRILLQRGGKVIGFCRKTPGKKLENGSSIPTGIFPVTFRPFPTKNSPEHGYCSPGNCRIPSGKIRRLSGRNTASMFQHFSGAFLQEPARII